MSETENQSQKYNNRVNAGRKARQDGENAKNFLASNLSYDYNQKNVNTEIETLLKTIGVSIEDVLFIHTKALADGKIKCSKSDIRVNIELKDGSKKVQQISLKSTYGKTQVATHTVKSFAEHLANRKVIIPEDVLKFIFLFTNSNHIPDGQPKPFLKIYSKPNYIGKNRFGFRVNGKLQNNQLLKFFHWINHHVDGVYPG